MSEYSWANYRCRKCGAIVSKEKRFDRYRPGGERVTITGKFHNCKEGIEDGEAVIADWISVSDHPLAGAEVHYKEEFE